MLTIYLIGFIVSAVINLLIQQKMHKNKFDLGFFVLCAFSSVFGAISQIAIISKNYFKYRRLF